MRIMLCHNYYRQRGGEDESFEAEVALLRQRGHDPIVYTVDNHDIDQISSWQMSLKTFWNAEQAREVGQVVKRERPDVVHFTNTFPLLSPSVYYAARREGAAVVQSLRNYRLQCVSATFTRQGNVCESCLGKTLAWPGILHGCYRQSRLRSAAVAGMVAAHRLAGTWNRAVDMYFAPSEFARSKLCEGGMPAEMLAVKPNFISPDPGAGSGAGNFVAFVGRLQEEKGVDVLLDAWQKTTRPTKLVIIGTGNLQPLVQAAAQRDPRIEWTGFLPREQVVERLGDAACLVMPSIWYETFGRTIIEAFARGTPVIASRLGAMSELVEDGHTGHLFTPGSATELAEKIDAVYADPLRTRQMRAAARLEYLSAYTGEANYEQLIDIYKQAIARRWTRASSADKPCLPQSIELPVIDIDDAPCGVCGSCQSDTAQDDDVIDADLR